MDESWPTDGIPTLAYSRHKVAAERILDADPELESREHAGLRRELGTRYSRALKLFSVG